MISEDNLFNSGSCRLNPQSTMHCFHGEGQKVCCWCRIIILTRSEHGPYKRDDMKFEFGDRVQYKDKTELMIVRCQNDETVICIKEARGKNVICLFRELEFRQDNYAFMGR